MGNCLRILGLNQPDTDEEDAGLLDPGEDRELSAGGHSASHRLAASSSDSSDESPLLFRMLSTRGRRARGRRSLRVPRDRTSSAISEDAVNLADAEENDREEANLEAQVSADTRRLGSSSQTSLQNRANSESPEPPAAGSRGQNNSGSRSRSSRSSRRRDRSRSEPNRENFAMGDFRIYFFA